MGGVDGGGGGRVTSTESSEYLSNMHVPFEWPFLCTWNEGSDALLRSYLSPDTAERNP